MDAYVFRLLLPAIYPVGDSLKRIRFPNTIHFKPGLSVVSSFTPKTKLRK